MDFAKLARDLEPFLVRSTNSGQQSAALGTAGSGGLFRGSDGTLTPSTQLTDLVRSVTASLTLTEQYSVVLVDTTSAEVTISLPAASSSYGRRYTIKHVAGSSNRVIVQAAGADLIDGYGGLAMAAATLYQSVTISCNGSAWYIVAQVGTISLGSWWNDYGAISGALIAYRAIGASSQAASYVNLVTPSTYHATVGTAPSWTAGAGWAFDNATNQHLVMPYYPTSASQTHIIRFSGITAHGKIYGAHSFSGGSFDTFLKTGNVSPNKMYGSNGGDGLTGWLSAARRRQAV